MMAQRWMAGLMGMWGLFFIAGADPARAESANPVRRIGMADFHEMLSRKPHESCLVIFLAAWCGPCKEELPTVMELGRKYKSRGLSVLGVSLDFGGPPEIQPLVDAMKIDFPVYWAGEDPIAAFNISAIPLAIFFKAGKETEKVTGKVPASVLEEKIRAFLGVR